MKRFVTLAAVVLWCVPLTVRCAQTAQTRFYCLSLQFQQGDGGQGGLDTLDLTTLFSGINGELAPLFNGNYSQWSWFEWYSFYLDEVRPGTLNVDLPAFSDQNGNGLDDFFEVSQGVSAGSSGLWAFDGSGALPLTASWSRGAGTPVGTCTLNFSGYGSFTHNFILYEYTGPLSYTPGATNITGTVDLVETGNPAATLHGPIAFEKWPANRFNQLDLQPGVWTNAFDQTYVFHNDIDSIQRDLSRKTNYNGFVDMDDGEPNTGDPDYVSWYISIDDTNDIDHDGIPDFSDDLPLPRAPLLSLKLGTTNLLLTISGDVGRDHQVQEVSSLTDTNWLTVVTVNLTNDPQIVSLPLPAVSTRYWRVRAQ